MRQITHIESVLKDNKLQMLKVIFKKDSGIGHEVAFNRGEFHCDCQGFMRYEYCRHVDATAEIKNYILNAIDECLKEKYVG